MTRERIEDFREIVLPFLSRTLLETNYENLGKSDAEEFEKDFNEILNLAIKALEQEPVIDKIRAEIQENINYNKKMNYQGIVAGLLLTLNIINKYKAESEEQACCTKK